MNLRFLPAFATRILMSSSSSSNIPPPEAASSTTVVVGLNAALQKRFILPESQTLIPGNVHRADQIQTGVGGKGQDVAIALKCLEFSAADQQRLCLAQFVGHGSAGDTVHDLLTQLNLIDGCTIRTQAPMRTCTSIVATDSTTELVEPSGEISSVEYQALLDQLQQLSGRVDALCIMGSMPPGLQANTYAQIYETVMTQRQQQGGADAAADDSVQPPPLLCLIDAVVGLEPLWSTIGSTSNRCTMLKINAAELCRLSGIVTTKSTDETAGGVVREELESAIQAFVHKFPRARDTVDAIAITDGSHPAYLAALSAEKESAIQVKLYQVPVPRLDSSTKLYPIGAGDAVAAGTLAAWKCLTTRTTENGCLPSHIHQLLLDVQQRQLDPIPATLLTSLLFGISCGTASCLEEENSVLKLADVERFLGQVTSKNPELVSTLTI